MALTTHLVELTNEEIAEIVQAMTFTEKEGHDGDPKVWESILQKLTKIE